MAKSMKKRLSEQQEFDIMKMVLDKFLWLGFILMAFGLFKIFESGAIVLGLSWIIVGAFLLILFMILIVKEYEVIK
jgi:uncharacterized membrane-anchored protein